MIKVISFTQAGLEKVKKEKETLLESRKDAVIALRTAREMGDLSENAAYKVARQRLSSTDSRLRHLTYLIRFGQIVNPPTSGAAGIGSKVKMETNGKILEYTIVGSFESNPMEGTISHISPIGRAMIGKRKDDIVAVTTPGGVNNFKILSIS